MNKHATLSVFALAMLITGAIDSIRNLPATALFGSNLVFFLLFGAVIFLIPTALVSADLASGHPDKGGVYAWVKAAFGKKIGFLAIWLQWINTMVWYPTILSFIAGTAAYLIAPELAQNKLYLVSVILIVFWSLTLINLKGLHASTRFASFCAITGMIIPMALIIFCGFLWVIQGKPLQVDLSWRAMLPSLENTLSWTSLTAIMASFLGMELAAVHSTHVKDPHHAFPKALLISVFIILSTMLLGSLAIAAIIPQSEIGLVAGVMQAFHHFLAAYHLTWFLPILTLMLLIGSLGGMINWIISPAKGLLQAGQDGFLPAWLTKENQHGVAHHILIIQAVLVSVVCLAFLLMPSVNSSYWLLTDLSTQLYMLMYGLMFLAAIVLKGQQKQSDLLGFQIPGGKKGMVAVCLLGLFGCTLSLIVGFFPPETIDMGGAMHYELIFGLGMLAMIIPVFGFYQVFHKNQQTPQAMGPETALQNAGTTL